MCQEEIFVATFFCILNNNCIFSSVTMPGCLLFSDFGMVVNISCNKDKQKASVSTCQNKLESLVSNTIALEERKDEMDRSIQKNF